MAFSLATDQFLGDKARYPGTVSVAQGGLTDSAKAVVRLMDRYGWRKLSVVCDSLSRNPSVGAATMAFCTQTTNVFGAVKSRMSMVQFPTDSSVDNDTVLSEVILQAREHSSSEFWGRKSKRRH